MSISTSAFKLSESEIIFFQAGVSGGLRKRALVPNKRMTERLNMGATGAVNRAIAEARKRLGKDRKMRLMTRSLEADVDSF